MSGPVVLFKGKQVHIAGFHFGDDVVDTYITKAFYVDNGNELFDDALEQIGDLYPELLWDEWNDHYISAADAAYDEMMGK